MFASVIDTVIFETESATWLKLRGWYQDFIKNSETKTETWNLKFETDSSFENLWILLNFFRQRRRHF